MSRNLRSSDHDQTCSPSSTAPTASVSITAAGRQQACCISSRRSAVHRTKHTVFKSRRFRAKQLDAPSTDIDEITTDLNRIKFKKRNKRVIRADRKRQRRLIKELIHSDDTDGVHSASIVESTTSENPASTSQDDAPKRYRHRNSAKQIASLNRSINRLGFQSPAKRRKHSLTNSYKLKKSKSLKELALTLRGCQVQKPLFVGWICDDINRADDIKLNYKHPITQESNAQPCCSISSLYSPPSIISTSRATPVKSVLSDCIDCDANSTPRNCPKIILL